VPGLVPLGPAPLAPQPAAAQPLASAYSPLGAAPAPLDGNLLAGLPPAQFSGQTLPPAQLAPAPSFAGAAYSAPLGGGYSDTLSDAGRKGLPWEREANFDNFQDTAMVILSEPHVTFRQMRRHGGLLNPLAFLMIGLLVGSIATSVYYLVFMLIVIMSTAPQAEAFAGLGIAAAAMLFGNLIGAIIASVVGSFVAAGFWHVVLLVFGAARGGFEGTYRAVCFTAGSIALLNVLPIVGPLVGIVLGIVVMIHAFIHTHEAPSGRVVAAVLIPYALACCCALPGLFTLVPVAMAGLRGF
jgi:hypothetical protein